MPVLQSPPPLVPPVDIIEEIKKTARGAFILKDWLGEGGHPVCPALARQRAFICISCPKNQPSRWWDKAKDKIAGTIKEYLAVKRVLNLNSPLDSQIGTCEVCGCNLPLAIWVPIKHVKAQTPPAEMEKFESFCWKKLESNP